jgi:hypothetical protein
VRILGSSRNCDATKQNKNKSGHDDDGARKASLPPLTRHFCGHAGGIALLKYTVTKLQ